MLVSQKKKKVEKYTILIFIRDKEWADFFFF